MPESTPPISSGSGHATRVRSAAEELWALWRRGHRPDLSAVLARFGPLSPPQLAEVLRVDQRERWQRGERVLCETYLHQYPAVGADVESAVDLVYHEFLMREKSGDKPTLEEYAERFPELADVLRVQIDLHEAMEQEVEIVQETARFPGSSPRSAGSTPHLAGYEVLGELGRGGMGVVYRARQLALDRPVAIKLILAGAHAGVEVQKRFQAEAEAIAKLRHPNIVQVYDFGFSDGQPYLALELVEGGTLARRAAGVPQPAREAAQLVETLASAVHYAHSQGLVHRDIKPANILLTADGVLKITDFGLVKRLEGGSAQTSTGALLGTPSYMAPEQATGDRGPVGPKTDVYALGVLLYELLTGRPPFQGNSALEILQKIQEQDPLPPRRFDGHVPRDLETICLKCLEKEPARRYATAAALADDLRRFQAGEPVRARPLRFPARMVRWSRRRPAVTALLGLVVLVTAVGAGVALVQWVNLLAAWHVAAIRADAEAKAKGDAQRALAESHANLYTACLALAEREWRDGNPERVRDFLDRCPPEFRGWEWHYLHRLGDTALRMLHGHRGQLTSVAYSSDGRLLASGGQDKTVKIWDAQTGREIHSWTGPSDTVNHLAFSADSRYLAAGSADRSVRIWDLDNPNSPRVFADQSGEVLGVAFHPSGRWLAVATGDSAHSARVGELRILNLVASDPPIVLKGHTAAVTSVDYSRDGRFLASGSEDGTVRIWDAADRSLLRVLKAPTSSSSDPPEENRLLRIEDPRRGKEVAFRLYLDGVNGIAFSPDGRWLAGAMGDGRILIWATDSGLVETTIRAHWGVVTSVAYSFDGTRFVSSGRDGFVKLWDAKTRVELWSYKGHLSEVYAAVFSPDDKRIASAGADRVIRIWDATQEQDRLLLRGHAGNVFGLAFSPDGERLATGSGNLFNPLSPGEVKIWDVATRQELFTLRGHKGGVAAVAYSPDGKRLASGSGDGTVKVWDLVERKELHSLKCRSGTAFSVGFSPNGRWLACGTGSLLVPARVGEVTIWDAVTGEEVRTLGSGQGAVGSVAFSPDSRLLATGGADRVVHIWDVENGNEVKALHGHTEAVFGVAFSPKGEQIASCSGAIANPTRPGEVKLWDVASGTEKRSLHGHTQIVDGIAFSPDGRRLISSSRDATVKLWDTQTGQQVLSLHAADKYICSLAVSRDGRRIASGNWSGTVNVWEAE